ncbi:hypothetical protein LK540_20400 [Massilia sp. IC2-278]|uniref:hypothetical protein n=1 Tax=Massilia sp. IC2-278 TaxID=2887200 RepID=UPI001E2CA429|nr:hypothetical protein [Massilia sp. IC2-278]MCC2962797.1 hypothetical protein [Massilia sp. IC2-278]
MESSLYEVDGSCRDINFSEYISTSSACSLIEFIGARWELTRALDSEGEQVERGALADYLGRREGTLLTVWDGTPSPRHLQAWFHWTSIDQVFCELTFFPEDLEAGRFDDFLDLVASLVKLVQSREYYVRVENASWRHTDGGSKPDVIFSHESLTLLGLDGRASEKPHN